MQHSTTTNLNEMVKEAEAISTISNTIEPSEEIAEGQSTITAGTEPIITPEPQKNDQLHLDVVARTMKDDEIYFATTDDEGAIINQPELYNGMIDLLSLDTANATNLNELLEENLSLVISFTIALDKRLAAIAGILCRYFVITGMCLNKIKLIFFAIKKGMQSGEEQRLANHGITISKDTRWIEFLGEVTKGHKSLRSWQNYMQLAKATDAFSYACLGQERLLGIYRAENTHRKTLSKTDQKKPYSIAEILDTNGVDFDLADSPNPSKEQMNSIDVVIFRGRATKAAMVKNMTYEDLGLDDEKVKGLITNRPKTPSAAFCTALVASKISNGDPNILIDRLMSGEPVRSVTGAASEEHDSSSETAEIAVNDFEKLEPYLENFEGISSSLNTISDLFLTDKSLSLMQKIVDNLTLAINRADIDTEIGTNPDDQENIA